MGRWRHRSQLSEEIDSDPVPNCSSCIHVIGHKGRNATWLDHSYHRLKGGVIPSLPNRAPGTPQHGNQQSDEDQQQSLRDRFRVWFTCIIPRQRVAKLRPANIISRTLIFPVVYLETGLHWLWLRRYLDKLHGGTDGEWLKGWSGHTCGCTSTSTGHLPVHCRKIDLSSKYHSLWDCFNCTYNCCEETNIHGSWNRSAVSIKFIFNIAKFMLIV